MAELTLLVQTVDQEHTRTQRARDKRVHCVFIHYENDSVDEHVTSVNGFGDMTVTRDQLRTQNPDLD